MPNRLKLSSFGRFEIQTKGELQTGSVFSLT